MMNISPILRALPAVVLLISCGGTTTSGTPDSGTPTKATCKGTFSGGYTGAFTCDSVTWTSSLGSVAFIGTMVPADLQNFAAGWSKAGAARVTVLDFPGTGSGDVSFNTATCSYVAGHTGGNSDFGTSKLTVTAVESETGGTSIIHGSLHAVVPSVGIVPCANGNITVDATF
jgi:hypothetical protein